MPLKRRTLAIILIAIIALALAAWLIGNQTADQTENQLSTVKIADFKWTSSWSPGPVGVLYGRAFNITLQNMGNRDMEGVSVDVKLFANNTELWTDTGLYGPGIIGYTAERYGFDGKLNANETRELRGDFVTRLDIFLQLPDWGEKTYSVRVTMNNTILDELSLPYP